MVLGSRFQASADRLPAIEAMATSWGGAMCVAIHISSMSELKQLYPKLRDLHARIEAQHHCRLDVCVATEDGLSTDTPSPAALYPVSKYSLSFLSDVWTN